MKRLILGGVILAAALLLNGEKTAGVDIGKLEPARVIMVEEKAGTVSVSTDLGQQGRGRTLTEAVADMKAGAAGEVFLDTAEYLLVAPSAVGRLEETFELLRNSCQVSIVNGVDDPAAAGEYLAAHKPGVTLGDCLKGLRDLPVLYLEGERMKLAEP